jgi:hypothetical protein
MLKAWRLSDIEMPRILWKLSTPQKGPYLGQICIRMTSLNEKHEMHQLK